MVLIEITATKPDHVAHHVIGADFGTTTCHACPGGAAWNLIEAENTAAAATNEGESIVTQSLGQ